MERIGAKRERIRVESDRDIEGRREGLEVRLYR